MNEFVRKFKELLDAGNIEEAKKLLQTLGTIPESAKEHAEMKLLLTDLYVKLTNAANQAYLDGLNETIRELSQLQNSVKAIDEAVKLAETRSSLAE